MKKTKINAEAERCLIQRGKDEAEAHRDYKVQFELDLNACLCLCGNLQLAQRHPMNTGPSSDVARQLIRDIREGLRDCGLTAHAEIIAMGDDRANDYDPRPERERRKLAIVRAGTTGM